MVYRKTLAAAVMLLVVVFLVGCSSNSSGTQVSLSSRMTYEAASVSISDTWGIENNSNWVRATSDDNKIIVSISRVNDSSTATTATEIKSIFDAQLKETQHGKTIRDWENAKYASGSTFPLKCTADYAPTLDNLTFKGKYSGRIVMVANGANIYELKILVSEGDKSKYEGLLEEIEESFEVVFAEIPVSESASSETGNSAGTSAAIVTSGMTNALKSAKNYLQISAWSYSGLIEQLEYEGYTTDEATYAADKCGADWNEQAAKSAKQYIEIATFSRASLIEQLEYVGFTEDQAVYGVDSVGY